MTYDARERSRNAAAPIECYRIEVGATIYLWTSHDNPVVFAGDTYLIEPIRSSGADFSNEDHAGTIKVYVSRLNPVAQLFLPFTPPSPVKITVFRFHKDEPDFVTAFAGAVTAAAFQGSEVELTCARKNSAFKRRIPRLGPQKRCPLHTYGIACGLDQELFKDTGTVLMSSGYSLQVLIDPVRADGWYTAGWVELADGTKRFITDHVGDILTLEAPFLTVGIGDAISVFWGDDHLEETCRDKFNNIEHFLGEPRAPDQDPQQTGLN